MDRANLHPSPHARWTLDNLTNPFVNRTTVCADFARFEAELTMGRPSIAKGPSMQPLRQRLKTFKLPEYLWDGILIKRFCYSLTAQTGAGKTAIAIRFAFHVARGEKLCGRDVERGPVIYLAGENPDDVDMRWLGICHAEGVNPDDLDIHIIAGAGNIMEHAEQIKNTCRADNIRPTAIIVDTAAAYFSGDDDNHNTQMGSYARQLRELCQLPGEPCIVILVHPTKGAKDFGEMVPRGGGAFLNEMDGNLGAVRDGATVGVQTVGKFRGPEFTPLHFGLHTVHD
ncbi:MAG: AAA family ATPase, partial [Bradyrhizobium sp.]